MVWPFFEAVARATRRRVRCGDLARAGADGVRDVVTDRLPFGGESVHDVGPSRDVLMAPRRHLACPRPAAGLSLAGGSLTSSGGEQHREARANDAARHEPNQQAVVHFPESVWSSSILLVRHDPPQSKKVCSEEDRPLT